MPLRSHQLAVLTSELELVVDPCREGIDIEGWIGLREGVDIGLEERAARSGGRLGDPVGRSLGGLVRPQG